MEPPAPGRAPKRGREERPLRTPNGSAGGFIDDLSVEEDDPEFEEGRARRRRRGGVRVRIAGLVPRSLTGRAALVAGLMLVAGGAAAGAWWGVRNMLLRDGHFVVESADSIGIAGNSRLTRAQLLSVFGGDVERNIFTVPLSERRAELEALPWVEEATVMRLLPNRIRVAIVERTPVAFVRQGGQIGLVDASGVLLDMDPGEGRQAYSFPVLTGISAADPLSTRAARMKIYLEFVKALDADGEHISGKLSEVDLSNPEDVRAVVDEDKLPVLVHFGEEKYLERYHEFARHLAEWRQQYPKLASVDMRYERQVVLEMQQDPAADGGDGAAKGEAAKTARPAAMKKPAVVKAGKRPAGKARSKSGARPAARSSAAKGAGR